MTWDDWVFNFCLSGDLESTFCLNFCLLIKFVAICCDLGFIRGEKSLVSRFLGEAEKRIFDKLVLFSDVRLGCGLLNFLWNVVYLGAGFESWLEFSFETLFLHELAILSFRFYCYKSCLAVEWTKVPGNFRGDLLPIGLT